jgi:hypothetical protein
MAKVVTPLLLSTLALWTWTASATHWLRPSCVAFEIVAVEVLVTISFLAMSAKVELADTTEVGWLGIAFVGLLASLLFVETSCSGSLQLRMSGLYCESYKPGWISMIFDIASIGITLAAPACALRRALMRMAS